MCIVHLVCHGLASVYLWPSHVCQSSANPRLLHAENKAIIINKADLAILCLLPQWKFCLVRNNHQIFWHPLPVNFAFFRKLYGLGRQIRLNSLVLDNMAHFFAYIISKCIFFIENGRVMIKISLKFVTYCPVDKKSVMLQVMARHWPCDKPLPKAIMAQIIDAYNGSPRQRFTKV